MFGMSSVHEPSHKSVDRFQLAMSGLGQGVTVVQ